MDTEYYDSKKAASEKDSFPRDYIKRTITLNNTIDAISSFLPRSLISPPHLSRIRKYAQHFPAHISGFFGFETRLCPKQFRTDFAMCAFKGEDGFGLLANCPLPSVFIARDIHSKSWKKIRSFCKSCITPDSPLQTYIKHVWLEFDIDPAQEGFIAPSFFFGFKREGWNHEATDNHWLLADAFPLLAPPDIIAKIESPLAHCLQHLPASVDDLQIGVIFSRKVNYVRLWMDAVAADELFDFLHTICALEAPAEFEKKISPFLQYTDKLFVDLDIGDRIFPHIGVEFYMGDLLGLGDREVGLIHQLVSHKLCTEEKMRDLLNWPGMTRERFSHLHGEAKLYRSINHIKLDYRPGEDPEAKAYLLVDVV